MATLLSRRLPGQAARPSGPNPRRRTELGLLVLSTLIIVAAYVLAAAGTTAKIPADLGPFLAIVIGLGLAAHIANRFYAPDANPVLLPLVSLLNGLGYVMIARIGPPKYATAQAGWTAVGVGAYIVTLLVVRRSRDLDRYRYLLLLGAVVFMLSPLIPHLGNAVSTQNSTVKLWVRIGPISGQPVELAKLALCIFFASYFAEKRELLSVATYRLGNRLVLDPRPLGPILLAWGFAMLVLGAERDIGFALLIFVLFIAMLWLATGRGLYVVVGFIMFAVGALIASHLFSQVDARVQNWLHPWTRVNLPVGGSGQLVSGLYGMGTGGLTGTGLGFGLLGNSLPGHVIIPEVNSDYIFAAFGTEMGLLGTTLILFCFVLIVGAGLRIAQTARSEFAKLLAAGLTVIIGMQAFFIMAGIVRLLPLTGITLPFMAYGGSSLVANYVLIALLMRISDEGERAIVAAQATATPVASAGGPSG
ncbi:MAG TPA: FtsW/RodA/SpoVE family cell cycle protein [Acidimicrobiales bacterium]|nr:FtsW/RodA/SpoVE family cell cycle protein [Acidimicrobiales bacterium]